MTKQSVDLEEPHSAAAGARDLLLVSRLVLLLVVEAVVALCLAAKPESRTYNA